MVRLQDISLSSVTSFHLTLLQVFQGSAPQHQNESAVQIRLHPESDHQLPNRSSDPTDDDETNLETDNSKHTSWKDTCPLDWCLKTRVRFISDSPFTWCGGTLKTNEEAAGLSWFVRGTSHEDTMSGDAKVYYNSGVLHYFCSEHRYF